MVENFSMEWNVKWKIFGMEWKKIASMKYGKTVFHSISYHALFSEKESLADIYLLNNMQSNTTNSFPFPINWP